MKELSIEQKAKRYDEALKQIKGCTPDENGFVTIYPQEIFPELKESDDERIRKALIEYFNDFRLPTFAGLDPKKILAWLEKQGEQKPVEWNNEEKTRLMKKCVHRAYQQGYDTGFLMATTELEHNSTWSEAFIKKAEEWLRNNQQGFILTDKDITDFVNYP